MASMVAMIKITKTFLATSLLVLAAGCTTTTTKTAQNSAPMAQPQNSPSTDLSYTRGTPDGGLAPVAEAPHASSWGNTFLVR